MICSSLPVLSTFCLPVDCLFFTKLRQCKCLYYTCFLVVASSFYLFFSFCIYCICFVVFKIFFYVLFTRRLASRLGLRPNLLIAKRVSVIIPFITVKHPPQRQKLMVLLFNTFSLVSEVDYTHVYVFICLCGYSFMRKYVGCVRKS